MTHTDSTIPSTLLQLLLVFSVFVCFFVPALSENHFLCSDTLYYGRESRAFLLFRFLIDVVYRYSFVDISLWQILVHLLIIVRKTPLNYFVAPYQNVLLEGHL